MRLLDFVLVGIVALHVLSSQWISGTHSDLHTAAYDLIISLTEQGEKHEAAILYLYDTSGAYGGVKARGD